MFSFRRFYRLFSVLILMLFFQKLALAFDSFEHIYLGDSFPKNFYGFELAPNNQAFTPENPYPYEASSSFLGDPARTQKIGPNLPAVSKQFLRVFPVGVNGDVRSAYDNRGGNGSIYYDYAASEINRPYALNLKFTRARKNAASVRAQNISTRFALYVSKIEALKKKQLEPQKKKLLN